MLLSDEEGGGCECRLCNWLAGEDDDIWRTSTVAKEAKLIETRRADDEKHRITKLKPLGR